jgi:hypothetical protein
MMRQPRLVMASAVSMAFFAGILSDRLYERAWYWGPLEAARQVIANERANGAVLDEAVFGEFPFEITDWSATTITIDVSGSSSENKSYVASWLERNKTLGRYRLAYLPGTLK